MNHEDHEATEKAMKVLRQLRRQQIEEARVVAIELIRQRGKTNCREVRNRLHRLGALDETFKDHWLGCVFRDKRFEWTGEWVMPTLPANTSIHAQRPVKVWRLA